MRRREEEREREREKEGLAFSPSARTFAFAFFSSSFDITHFFSRLKKETKYSAEIIHLLHRSRSLVVYLNAFSEEEKRREKREETHRCRQLVRFT